MRTGFDMDLAMLVRCVMAAILAGIAVRAQGCSEDCVQDAITWHNIGPGGGGWLPSLLISHFDNDRMFAGCDVTGFFASKDAGRHWTGRNMGLTDYYVGEIVEHPVCSNVLFVGSWGGLHKSTDGGRSWRVIRAGFPAPSRGAYTSPIARVLFHPDNPDVVFAFLGDSRGGFPTGAGRKAGVYRSEDGGETFCRIDRDGSFPPKTALLDADIVAKEPLTFLVTVCGSGVYRSTDGGVSWCASNVGLPHSNVWHLAAAPSKPSVVYLALSLSMKTQMCDSGVFKSTDGGLTWRETGAGLPQIPPRGGNAKLGSFPKCVQVHPKNPDVAYAGMNGWVSEGVCKTTDGGKTWKVVVDNRSSRPGWIKFWGPSVESLTIGSHPPYPVAFGTPGYIWRSDDGGGTWSQRYTHDNGDGTYSSTGLETTCLHSINFDIEQKNRYYFGYFDIGLMITDDNGRSLRRSTVGLHKDGNNCMGVVQASDAPDTLWGAFGQWGDNDGIIARSDDRGRTWRSVGEANGWQRATAYDLVLIGGKAPDCKLACRVRSKGISITEDGGCHWHSVATNVFERVKNVSALAVHAGILYAGVPADERMLGEVWSSSDGGRRWSRLSPVGLQLPDIKRVRAFGSDLFVAAREKYQSLAKRYLPGGVWHSVDGGISWRLVYSDRYVTDMLVMRDGNWIVATSDDQYHDKSVGDGVLMSCDNGRTWRNVSGETLGNRHVTVLAEDVHRPGIVWAGTQGGSLFVGKIRGLPEREKATREMTVGCTSQGK